jgi:uncharacterized protein (TIGR02145 family)
VGFAMHYFFFIMFCSLLLSSCSDDGTSPNNNTPQDTVETITIGNQVWMTKNLDVAIFQNGDTIPEAKTPEEWIKAGETKTPTWCYYDFNKENGRIYGKLYNWYVVNDSRKIAPNGFHIATDKEWDTLTNFAGGDSLAGKELMSVDGWGGKSIGTNSFGFSGFPGGYCGTNGLCYAIGQSGYWWSASESNQISAWLREIYIKNTVVAKRTAKKYEGLSIRCIKD